ncbi:hypothetical protein SprV_0200780400 [Sparganum proliferum]
MHVPSAVVSQNPGQVFVVDQGVWGGAPGAGSAAPSTCALPASGLFDSIVTPGLGWEEDRNKYVKRVSPKARVIIIPGSSSPFRRFYVRDNRIDRLFPVDAAAHLGVIPPLSAKHWCSDLGLFLQAVSITTAATFGIRSLCLEIGHRPVFPWVFVVADSPCVVIGADLLVTFRSTARLLSVLSMRRGHQLHCPGCPFL